MDKRIAQIIIGEVGIDMDRFPSAATLALALAETLGTLTLAYAIDPDAVISLDICPYLTAVDSTIFPYAGADRLPLVTAAMQLLADFYKRPGGCHGGKTDAFVPGVQAGMEKALSIIFPVLAGATGVGTMGYVENALTFSYEQLVIDDAIAGYIRCMLRGFEVNPETLALEVIREVGPGGNFLAHPHTAVSFRKEFYLPDIVERMSYAAWRRRSTAWRPKPGRRPSASWRNIIPGRWTQHRSWRSMPLSRRPSVIQPMTGLVEKDSD